MRLRVQLAALSRHFCCLLLTDVFLMLVVMTTRTVVGLMLNVVERHHIPVLRNQQRISAAYTTATEFKTVPQQEKLLFSERRRHGSPLKPASRLYSSRASNRQATTSNPHHDHHKKEDPTTRATPCCVVDWWSETLQQAYQDAETDGVLQLLTNTPSSMTASDLKGEETPPSLPAITPHQLWEAVTRASHRTKGPAASMLNALLASTCACESNFTTTSSTTLLPSLDPLKLFDIATMKQHNQDSKSSPFTVQPDTVTYSLLYTSLMQKGEATPGDPHGAFAAAAAADAVLEQALRASRKAAGSARRRARAAQRRRQSRGFATFREAEGSVREWLGDGEPSEFAVLYETDDCVVVNKPAGVSCFHKHSTNAGKIYSGKQKRTDKNTDVSLEDALVATGVPLSTLNPDARGLVHRLDRGTSGCLCLAKNDATHCLLVTDFFLRRNRKTYQCLVQSTVRGKSPGDAADALQDNAGTVDIAVHGRPAVSHYRVLERYNNDAALLDVETRTGRKHQVRVHCAKGLGHPIVGDDLYGRSKPQNNKGKQQQQKQRFHLHAASLQLPLLSLNGESSTRSSFVIKAPLPSWWTTQVKDFKES